MQRVNEYRFCALGAALERLKDLSEKTTLWDAFLPCIDARNALSWLLVDPVSLRVCRPAVQRLLNDITATLPTPPETGNPTAPIGSNANLINAHVTELRTLLEAECATLDTYVVSQKGAYSMPVLIGEAELLLPKSTRQRLDTAAIQDIQQAGRCLAFDLPTAAAFHLFRAVESVTHLLYDRIKNSPQEDKQLIGWQAYINALKALQVVPSKVTDLLIGIKDHYRNPIAHPDATLTTDQANGLLPLAVTAITAMVDVMPDDGPKDNRQALAELLRANPQNPA